MIQWLLNLVGVAPRVAPARRRSLAARLRESNGAVTESSIMVDAQAALARHARREEAIQEHKAEVSKEKAQSDRERQEHQTDICESTVSLEKVHRDTTRRRGARRMQLIDVSEAAREEARKKRESGG